MTQPEPSAGAPLDDAPASDDEAAAAPAPGYAYQRLPSDDEADAAAHDAPEPEWDDSFGEFVAATAPDAAFAHLAANPSGELRDADCPPRALDAPLAEDDVELIKATMAGRRSFCF